MNIVRVQDSALLHTTQETMESFAFPDKLNSKSTKIPHKSNKLYFFSLE